jgi:ABC-2 type transport system ATP-binding protein
MEQETLVEFRDLAVSYGPLPALAGVSGAFPAGATGLLGPNGAGKTTTIRMILNIIAPDEGTIRILGVSFSDPRITDRIGYLPEERGLYRKMQVRRVLRFLAELKGVNGAVADKRITEWLERFDLMTAEKDWGLSKIDELSRGMQQKVQFIGTLLHDPDLVILDEPFSGLDPINAQALKDTIVDLKRRGKTVIFSTHVMDNAERICDSVCIIARGKKVLDGSIRAIKDSHGSRNVALSLVGGSSNGVGEILADRKLVKRVDDSNRYFEVELVEGANAQELLHRIVATGAVIERFELVQPSLHQIFLERVGARSRAPGEEPWAEGVELGMTGHG